MNIKNALPINTYPRCPYCERNNMPAVTKYGPYEHGKCPDCRLSSKVKYSESGGILIASFVRTGRRGLGLVHRSLRVEQATAEFFDTHPDAVNRHVIELGIERFKAV